MDGVEGRVTIEALPPEAPETPITWGAGSSSSSRPRPKDQQYMSSVTAGPGADHTLDGHPQFSFYDRRLKEHRFKQAGRGGPGHRSSATSGSRRCSVRQGPVRANSNHVADLEAHQAAVGLDMPERRVREFRNPPGPKKPGFGP